MLGSDDDFWLKVGIDPVRMMTSGGTYYTLRCYLDDQPIFLGRNGRVSVFSSGGALGALSGGRTRPRPVRPGDL